jgi:transposase-like protein
MRGKAHSDDVKAKVIAALLLGAGVMEVARELRLPESSVRNYKRVIPGDKLAELNAKKGERLDDLVFDYMQSNLVALQRQAEVASDVNYIQKQPAGELATLHGVMADKIVRLLEAASRAREPKQLGKGDEES